jgi:hypothetical protein
MSAPGQERRIGAVRNISALPPRADVGADIVEPPVSARNGLMHRSRKHLYSITSLVRAFCGLECAYVLMSFGGFFG